MKVNVNKHIVKDLFLFICKICEQGNPSITYNNICYHFDDPQKLIDLRAFKEDKNNWIEDDDGNYQTLCYQNNKLGYINKNKEWIEASYQDITTYKLDVNWIVKTIANNLDLTKYPYETIIDEYLYRIGNLSNISIFFARRFSNKSIFENIYKSLSKIKGINKGVILTSSTQIPFGCSRLLDHEVLSLKNCLTHDSKNFHIDQNILKATLGQKIKKEGFSNGYHSGYFNNNEYSFTKKQAAVIEALHKYGSKMNKDELLAEADSNQYDLSGLFRNNKGDYHPAWNVIIKNDGKGNYWLDC